jgi:hypothetical protein
MSKLLNVGLGDVDKFTNKNKNSHTSSLSNLVTLQDVHCARAKQNKLRNSSQASLVFYTRG